MEANTEATPNGQTQTYAVENKKISFVDDYIVVDTETTGLKPDTHELIEIAALRVRGGIIENSFSSLIKPVGKVPAFISRLTGITSGMLKNAPPVEHVIPLFLEFVGDAVILGHNTPFDMGFISANTQRVTGNPFSNATLDTLPIARALVPKPIMPNHKLGTLAEAFRTPATTYHRALADCETTYRVYEFMKQCVAQGSITVLPVSGEDPAEKKAYSHAWTARTTMAKNIVPTTTEFDRNHPLFARRVVFTGELRGLPRDTAMQIVADAGGKPADNITFHTDLVVVGDTEHPTGKLLKARDYQARGAHLQIIDEARFRQMAGSFESPTMPPEEEMPF